MAIPPFGRRIRCFASYPAAVGTFGSTETKMTDAVIVSTARTGFGKSWKGAFNMTHGAALAGHVVGHAVRRAGVEPDSIEDVILGCANGEGATGYNIAR